MKLNIAHVITRLIVGGAQENTLLTCEGQAEAGHRVTLIVGPTAGPEGSLMARAQANPKINIVYIDSLVRSVNPLHDRRALDHLRRTLAELQPDVVHTHSAKGGYLGRRAAFDAVPQAAIVHTIHGQSFHRYQNPLVRALYTYAERRAARWTDHFISVCNAMTEQAVAARLAPPEKFTTVYSGMEVDRFLHSTAGDGQIRRSLGVPQDAVLVVKVARLFHLKGHEDVIRAMGTLIEHHPTLHLALVGDGILRARLQRMARRRGIEKRLHFAGLVRPDEVPAYIHAADILVHASYREGLARVLPQAMLAGRPAVSYDIDGACEVVHTGRTGILVAPGDWTGLARAIETLVADKTLRQQLGRCGRDLCRHQFDHNHMVQEIEKVYNRVLEAKAPRTTAAQAMADAEKTVDENTVADSTVAGGKADD